MPANEKIIIFAPFNFAASFLGLNLEFLQQELDKGNEVWYITCDKSFTSCGFNTFELKYMCEICTKRFHQNKHLVSGKFITYSFNQITNQSDVDFATQQLANITDIAKTHVVDNFEVGESVYSSLISKTKEKSFSSPEEMEVLRKLAHQSLIVYMALRRFIDNQDITKIILFNGRWDYYRAALSAARLKQIKIQVIENLRTGGYYEEFGDALPHNIQVKNELIESHWNAETDLELKKQVTKDFFTKKRIGIPVMGKVLTLDQKKGLLPPYIDPAKRLIVIYNSSDYEYEAVGKEYSNPFFPDQAASILHIAGLVAAKSDFQLIIRMHPNLKGLQRNFLKPLYELAEKYPNVFVIPPEDEVDSYALMDKAFKVITYVSFMGIEASYWGKSVILMGKSLYTHADVAYAPQSVEQIPSLLFEPLEPKPQINAEKYAYYYVSGGLKAKHYSSDSKNIHYFKNRSLVSFSLPFKIYYKALKALGIRN
jgi:hypothetical protein